MSLVAIQSATKNSLLGFCSCFTQWLVSDNGLFQTEDKLLSSFIKAQCNINLDYSEPQSMQSNSSEVQQ